MVTKQVFLDGLKKQLSCLPRQDLAEHLSFYGEMIDDRMEEGLSEADAVAAVGTVEEIAAQILRDMPHKRQKKKWKVWEIVLLALGSPVWLSLVIAAVAVAISLYASLWSVIVSLWATFAAAAASALGGVLSGTVLLCTGNALPGLAMLGGGIFCAGLAIFIFFGSKAATKGTAKLTKRIVLWAKRRIRNG